jgi:hypothetical protein
VSFIEPDFDEEPGLKERPPARRSARFSAMFAAYLAMLVIVVSLGFAAGVGFLVFKWVAGV